jgi:L-malate glycosyltransferase
MERSHWASSIPDVAGATSAPAQRRTARLSRVCLLIGQLGLGGTEKQVALLADGLRARGVDTTVLVMFEGGPYEAEIRAAGVPVVHLGFERRTAGWRMPAANALAFFRLVGRLRRTRPDVLHALLFHSYVTAAPAARLAGVPVLVAGRRGLAAFGRGRLLPRALEGVANRMTDHLVANARAVAADTGVPPHKISVVPNGLPDAAFRPAAPAAIATPLPLVLCVANLISYKGHRHLLDAVALLKTRGLACTLALAGEGPERAALRRQAEWLGIDVRFLGLRTDIGRLLARADAVVLPSLREGFSNAVMEAMAAGHAVVATDVGGTGELLRDRGILVPPADPGALADGIRQVLDDPAHAAELGVRARAWCEATLSADTMVDRHIRIYQDLLDRETGAE